MSQSRDIVQRYTWWSVAAGLIPVPLYNFAVVTGVQIRMMSQLSKAYDVPFSEDRGKAIASGLVGGYLPQTLSRGGLYWVARSVPAVGGFLGPVLTPALAGATTYGLGKVFNAHLASGGTAFDFNVESPEVQEEFADAFEEGKEEAAKAEAAQKKTKKAS